ncbi:MAG: efflux RND transporter periplasmic adaptor subunit [Verrucomicrobiia bacterium]
MAGPAGRPYLLRGLAGAAALLALVLLTGCSKGSGGGPPPDMATEVVIGKASLMPVEDTVGAVGTVEANERVEIKPKVSGLIESVDFVEGQRVRQGEKLFQLDSGKERASLAQAEAEEALARANLSRAQTLIGTKAISRQEVDQLQSEVAVKAALTNLEKERLIERTIVASFDGVVGPRLVSPGQYVTAGTALVTLVDASRLKVRFRIPERQLGMVRVGQPGRLSVSAYRDQDFRGEIDLIDPEVDPGTRTLEVRLMIPNEEGLLKPGMFANVDVVAGVRENAVVIPESAIVPSLKDFSVFAVEDGVAKLRPVTLGVRLPGKAEVLDGLTPEQPIVISGTQKLVDGMKVVAAAPVTAAQRPATD